MILITGATGLVGSHLTLHLAETEASNNTIRAIYRSPSAIDKTKTVFELYNKTALFSRIEWFQADITNVPSLEKAFQNIDFVYHCAASVSFDPDDEDLLRKTNIEGTANIVNCCLSFNVKKMCFVSTIAALGDLKAHENIINEETEWNPESPHSDYGISKHGAEMEVFRGQHEGIQTVIVNPGVILGPVPKSWKDKSGSGEIFTRIANGLLFYTKGSTGFISVDDVVKIMALLMKSDINGARFILISENSSVEKILNTIADALHVKRPAIYARPWMTGISWRFEWLLSLFGKKRTLPKNLARALHNTDRISNHKIQTALNYEFENPTEYINRIAGLYK